MQLACRHRSASGDAPLWSRPHPLTPSPDLRRGENSPHLGMLHFSLSYTKKAGAWPPLTNPPSYVSRLTLCDGQRSPDRAFSASVRRPSANDDRFKMRIAVRPVCGLTFVPKPLIILIYFSIGPHHKKHSFVTLHLASVRQYPLNDKPLYKDHASSLHLSRKRSTSSARGDSPASIPQRVSVSRENIGIITDRLPLQSESEARDDVPQVIDVHRASPLGRVCC